MNLEQRRKSLERKLVHYGIENPSEFIEIVENTPQLYSVVGERGAEVIRRMFLDYESFNEIAQYFEVTEQRVRQLGIFSIEKIKNSEGYRISKKELDKSGGKLVWLGRKF
jgi:DNA-directed RNA polymerase sigma subunit (sigma70/sigma32)